LWGCSNNNVDFETRATSKVHKSRNKDPIMKLGLLGHNSLEHCACLLSMWSRVIILVRLWTIFIATYKAVLHIHTIVKECQITGLLHKIDPKIKKFMKKKILFVKSGATVVVCIQVCICYDKQWRWFTSVFWEHHDPPN